MAKVKIFKAESGISAEVNGTWFKTYCGIELEIQEGDDLKKVKEMAWNTVHQENDKQLREFLGEPEVVVDKPSGTRNRVK